MEDLRGATLRWIVSRRSPLLCSIASPSGFAGSIREEHRDGSLGASLAGVRWIVRSGALSDRVEFQDGPAIAEAQLGVGGYEVEIDGLARYRFVSRNVGSPRSRFHYAWADSIQKHALLFAPMWPGTEHETGEILVSETAVVEHVPILALLGILHFNQKYLGV